MNDNLENIGDNISDYIKYVKRYVNNIFDYIKYVKRYVRVNVYYTLWDNVINVCNNVTNNVLKTVCYKKINKSIYDQTKKNFIKGII